MKSYILFMNPCWGVDYTLKKKLEKENIPFEFVSMYGSKEEKKLYKKHEIRLTPALLAFDKNTVVDKLVTVDEIVEFLKNASNKEI